MERLTIGSGGVVIPTPAPGAVSGFPLGSDPSDSSGCVAVVCAGVIVDARVADVVAAVVVVDSPGPDILSSESGVE